MVPDGTTTILIICYELQYFLLANCVQEHSALVSGTAEGKTSIYNPITLDHGSRDISVTH